MDATKKVPSGAWEQYLVVGESIFPTLNHIINQINEDFCLRLQCLWAEFNLKLKCQGLRSRRRRGVGKIWYGLCLSSSVEYEQRRSWRPKFLRHIHIANLRGRAARRIRTQFVSLIQKKKYHFWNIRLRMLFVGILNSCSTVLGPVHGSNMFFGLIICMMMISLFTRNSQLYCNQGLVLLSLMPACRYENIDKMKHSMRRHM